MARVLFPICLQDREIEDTAIAIRAFETEVVIILNVYETAKSIDPIAYSLSVRKDNGLLGSAAKPRMPGSRCSYSNSP